MGGFRHGAIMGEGILGQDFEDMDLTLDEEGKLWVVTDSGWVYKFKKPGKLEFKILAIERPICATSSVWVRRLRKWSE